MLCPCDHSLLLLSCFLVAAVITELFTAKPIKRAGWRKRVIRMTQSKKTRPLYRSKWLRLRTALQHHMPRTNPQGATRRQWVTSVILSPGDCGKVSLSRLRRRRRYRPIRHRHLTSRLLERPVRQPSNQHCLEREAPSESHNWQEWEEEKRLAIPSSHGAPRTLQRVHHHSVWSWTVCRRWTPCVFSVNPA